MTLFMPKSLTIQFFFNFSNFIGLKMHGREARVNTSELGTETPGGQEIRGGAGLDGGTSPRWPSRRRCLGLPSPSSLLSPFLPLGAACRLSFSATGGGVFSLRLALVVFIAKWASPEFSLGLSSSSHIFRHWHRFCNWGMSAGVWHKCLLVNYAVNGSIQECIGCVTLY